MEFKEAMRIYSRICGGKELCDGCVLEHNCIVWDACDYGEAESILAKWAAEHPEKTIADDFFEKHPRAKKGTGGFPSVCAAACGYIEECPHDYSLFEYEKCWRRPLAEVE